MSIDNISRRQFLRTGLTAGSAAFTLGFLGCSQLMTNPSVESLIEPFGGFRSDPAGVLDLPLGFKYHTFSKTGETMDDGFLVPGGHDDMAAFPGPNGRTILVRNHELETDARTGAYGQANELVGRINSEKFHDLGQGTKPALGGTTTLIYNTRTKELENSFLVWLAPCVIVQVGQPHGILGLAVRNVFKRLKTHLNQTTDTTSRCRLWLPGLLRQYP